VDGRIKGTDYELLDIQLRKDCGDLLNAEIPCARGKT